jgi:hypothetical protein
MPVRCAQRSLLHSAPHSRHLRHRHPRPRQLTEKDAEKIFPAAYKACAYGQWDEEGGWVGAEETGRADPVAWGEEEQGELRRGEEKEAGAREGPVGREK